MKVTPAAAEERVDRTANRYVLAGVVLIVAAAVLMHWLAPNATAVVLRWLIIALAACGGFGLLLFAFGQLQLPTQAAGFDSMRAIAASSPDGLLVTDREQRILYANAAYRALSGSGATKEERPVERLFTGSPDVSESVYRLSQAAKSGGRAIEELQIAPRRAAKARPPGIAFASARSRARPGRD